MPRHAPILLATLLALLPTAAHAAPCPWKVSPQASQALYDTLQKLPAGACVLADQTVAQDVVQETWQKAGTPVSLQWAARACQGGEDGRLAPLHLDAFAAQCPEAAKALTDAAARPDFPAATKPVPRGQTQVLGGDYDLVRVTAALEVALLLALLVWLGLALRQLTRMAPPLRREAARWWWTALGLFALALLARLVVPPTLSNWYTTVLGATGVPQVDRYGAGHIALQWLLRAVLPWHASVVFAANALMGAAIVPLWLVALRQRGLTWHVATLAAGLLAVLPLEVRLTNSASEHVLAAFAWLAALVAWQACVRASTRLPTVLLAVLAAALGLLTVLTRVDAAAPLLAIALWVAVADRAEPQTPRRRRWLGAFAWLAVWSLAVAFILPLVQIAVVEQGTPIPHAQERWDALRAFLPGMRRLLFGFPGWVGPLVGAALLWGLLVGLARRPWLTLTAIATFMAIPLGIGRSPYDFILMRYFLPVLPVLTLFAALGFATVLRRTWQIPLLLFAVVAVGWPAWQLHYTFQDEYTWLDEQLQHHPPECTVAQIAVGHRHNFFRDVDCCLDLPRSPLVAEPGARKFVQADTPAELAAVPGQCVLYYEGAVCAMQATPEVLGRNPQELKWFQRQCAEMRHAPGLELLNESEVSAFGHTDAFAGGPVRVRVWRRGPQ